MTPGFQQTLQHFKIPLLIAAIAIALTLFGDAAQGLLRYDRTAILNGEWWRLLSAHLLHLSNAHLVMNLAGLLLVWALVGDSFSSRNWWLVLSSNALITGLALLIFNPQLVWYVGLSGVLHGLLVAGAIADIRDGHRYTWLLLIALTAKLAWEQLAGPLPGSEASAGGSVIVDAHLYGALGGLLPGLLLPLRTPAENRRAS